MSTTDVMSEGSIHSYSENSDNLVNTPTRCKRRTPPSTPECPTVEIQEEIDELLEDVPALGKSFIVSNKIGSGTFSSVYLAKLKDHPEVKERFALKHIIPTSHPSRTENELRCLQEIGGCDNVMGVKACLREKDHVVIVMPYFQHDKFQDYIKNVTLSEVQEYMRNLCLALQRVHASSIIHRDVKPSNFLFNRTTKQFALVDFGLAQKVPGISKKNSNNTLKRKCEANGKDSTQSRESGRLVASGKEEKCVMKTRKQSGDNQPALCSSPKKRKLEVDENCQGSPRKRRPNVNGERRLAVVDLNVPNNILNCENTSTEKATTCTKIEESANKEKTTLPESPIVCLEPVDANALTPTPEAFKPGFSKGVRSPRRALLTKRALDLSRGQLFNAASRGTTKSALGSQSLRKTAVVMGSSGQAMYQSVPHTNCHCFGQPMLCTICLSRSHQVAPRAGTPGFRSPEVLMKCPDQSTAVDMWAAGVIFLSLLSGRYPFFKANDDMTALAQIITIFGSEGMRQAARSYGKELLVQPALPSLDLKLMSQKLRGVGHPSKGKMTKSQSAKNRTVHEDAWANVPDEAFDLLKKLLDLNPKTRITAEDALKHPYLAGTC